MDSLRYWVTEMHVDGFRFDLASALARSFHDVDKLSGFFDVIQQDPVRQPGQAHRRAVGRRRGRLPGRRVPAAVDGVERQVPRHRARRLVAASEQRRARAGLPAVGQQRPLPGRRPPPLRVDQLRHRPRRLHPARPDDLRGQAQRGQRRGQPRRRVAQPRLELRRRGRDRRRRPSTRCAGGRPATRSRRCCCRPACRCCRWATRCGARSAATTTPTARTATLSWMPWDADAAAARPAGLDDRAAARCAARTRCSGRPPSSPAGRCATTSSRTSPGSAPHGRELRRRRVVRPAAAPTLGMYLDGCGMRTRGPRGEQVVDDSFLVVLHAGADAARLRPARLPVGGRVRGRPRHRRRAPTAGVGTAPGRRCPCSAAPSCCSARPAVRRRARPPRPPDRRRSLSCRRLAHTSRPAQPADHPPRRQHAHRYRSYAPQRRHRALQTSLRSSSGAAVTHGNAVVIAGGPGVVRAAAQPTWITAGRARLRPGPPRQPPRGKSRPCCQTPSCLHGQLEHRRPGTQRQERRDQRGDLVDVACRPARGRPTGAASRRSRADQRRASRRSGASSSGATCSSTRPAARPGANRRSPAKRDVERRDGTPRRRAPAATSTSAAGPPGVAERDVRGSSSPTPGRPRTASRSGPASGTSSCRRRDVRHRALRRW